MKIRQLLLATLMTFPAMSQANNLTLNVNLSPAGSFQPTSGTLKGSARKLPDGSIEASKLALQIKSLKTGIDLRDQHFWKHLNADKFPKAEITDVKGKDGKASGMLEVAGVKKPITLEYSEQGKNILAKFQVKASDYKLPEAEYMGVGVEDDVSGEAVITLK